MCGLGATQRPSASPSANHAGFIAPFSTESDTPRKPCNTNTRFIGTARAARIASAAIVASADIDAERSRLYLDLIHLSLSGGAKQTLEDTMNSLGYEYQSDFARRYFGEGKAEGKAEGLIEGRMEGRVELILALLAKGFGPLPDSIQTRVRCAQGVQLVAVIKRMLTAETLEQALESLH
jgi:hypothetical protein